jgi:hypothetical protein
VRVTYETENAKTNNDLWLIMVYSSELSHVDGGFKHGGLNATFTVD